MTNLRALYLKGNQIENIDVLKGLPKVYSLYLDGNPVKDWTPVGELKWLSTLSAVNCGLADLSFLKPLKDLKMLLLMDNKIEQLQSIIEMAKAGEKEQFARFLRIYLKGNPIDANSEQIGELKELGARISFE